MTNWDAVAAATGEDDDANWPGHKIEAFPTTVIVGTESKPCAEAEGYSGKAASNWRHGRRDPILIARSAANEQSNQPRYAM
jgi:hypothetical protein